MAKNIEYITPEQFINEKYADKVPNECMVYAPNNSASVYMVERGKKDKRYFARHALFVSWLNEGELLRVEWEPPPPKKNQYVDLVELDRLIKAANALQWEMSRDESLTLIQYIKEFCRHLSTI